MRNDARPIGEEFRDIAEHDDSNGAKDREPAEGSRDTANANRGVVIRNKADEPPDDSSDR